MMMTSSVERGRENSPIKTNGGGTASVPNRSRGRMQYKGSRGGQQSYGGSSRDSNIQQRGHDDLIAQLQVHLDRDKKDLKRFSQALKNIAATFESSTPSYNSGQRRNSGEGRQLTFADKVTAMLMQENVVEHLGSNEATNILWSIGRLDFRFHVPAHRELCLRLLSRLCRQEDGELCTSRQVTTALGGLARVGMKFAHLDEIQKKDVIRLISSVCSILNDREISNLMHSMNKMQVSWSILPRSVQDGLLHSFLNNVDLLSDQQGAMAVYSMGQLGVDINAVTPAIRDNIYIVVHQVLDDVLKHGKSQLRAKEGRFAVQQMSNAIYGLAKLDASYHHIPGSLQEKMKDSLVHGMAFMNDQEVSNTIYSHGIMGARWKDFAPELHDCLRSNTVRCYGNMIAQGVSNTIYGMGLMGAGWHSMGLDYQYCTLEAVIKTLGTADHEASLQGSPSPAGAGAPGSSVSSKDNFKSTPRRTAAYGGTSPQAVANIIYSLGVVGAQWREFPGQVKSAIFQGLRAYGHRLSSQEISNVVYGLGLLRCDYASLPPEIVDTLTVNLDRVATRRAARDGESDDKASSGSAGGSLNQQEVCATLHGFAKMNAEWGQMSEALKFTLLSCISNLHHMGALCLACTVYSMGILSASWESLPAGIRSILLDAARTNKLSDQTMANVVYGLSSMEARWDRLEPEWIRLILENLEREDGFHEDVPQHIANTLWGLAKMDATWNDLPRENLMNSFIRCKQSVNCQETSNVLYGIAWMDVAWDELSHEFQVSLLDALERTSAQMTIQEVANSMYSLALMTYDSKWYDIEPHCGEKFSNSGNGGVDNSIDNPDSFSYILARGGDIVNRDVISTSDDGAHGTETSVTSHEDSRGGVGAAHEHVDHVEHVEHVEHIDTFDALISAGAPAPSSSAPGRSHAHEGNAARESANMNLSSKDLLWKFHRIILSAYKRIPVTEYCKENYDQFAMYFELMRILQGGNDLVYATLGRIPRTSGPCATIPSRLHSTTVHAMLARLNALGDKDYSVVNEFVGLHGVMPLDAAVYKGDEPVALVEIDGEFHYKSLGQQLRRKDRFKEFLYKVHYPTLPLFRIRSDQCKVVGTLRAGSELAGWISSIVEGKAKAPRGAAAAAAAGNKKSKTRSSSTNTRAAPAKKSSAKAKKANPATSAATMTADTGVLMKPAAKKGGLYKTNNEENS